MNLAVYKINWGCFWGHAWDKWDVVRYSVAFRNRDVHNALYQDRKCRRCGKLESKPI